jgi:hypothetical protein
MDRDNETLKIENCPICSKSHIYGLKVQRAYVTKLLTQYDMRERPVAKSYTRYFICPTKQEKFQATITLFDSSSNRIESVDIIGLKNE